MIPESKFDPPSLRGCDAKTHAERVTYFVKLYPILEEISKNHP